jgi:hypothetical protein
VLGAPVGSTLATVTMVTSKQLYQELRSVLAPLLKREGFKSMKGGRLGWTRPTNEGHLFFWFQCNKWGWDQIWGSAFTLEFQVAPEAGDAMSLKGRFERIGYLLEGFEELDEIRRKNNSVIERLPGTKNGRVVKGTLPDGTEFIAQGFVVDPETAIYGRDIWMNYYSLEDAKEWGHYFEKKLLRFIELFESQKLSLQGCARDRFHKAMARVQAAKELSEKTQILAEYVSTETDLHYRSGAEHWLAEARRKGANAA